MLRLEARAEPSRAWTYGAPLLALAVTVVLGVVTKRNDRDRWHYGIYTFGCFLVALFGLGWLMYLGHG